MEEQDIRWEQRFSNFKRAFAKLSESVEFVDRAYFIEGRFDESLLNDTDDIIIDGLIQRFEYTHELAWNVMKDYARYQGNAGIGGSRDAIREAFTLEIIQDGKVWMDMIISRNETSHTYDEEKANKIFFKIVKTYYPAFLAFKKLMEQKTGKR